MKEPVMILRCGRCHTPVIRKNIVLTFRRLGLSICVLDNGFLSVRGYRCICGSIEQVASELAVELDPDVTKVIYRL